MNIKRHIPAFISGIVLAGSLGLVAAVSSLNLTTTQAPRQLAANPASMDGSIMAIVGQYTPPYQVDEATADTVYIRYSSDTGDVYILRSVTDASVTTFTRALDAWTNRASATYSPVIR